MQAPLGSHILKAHALKHSGAQSSAGSPDGAGGASARASALEGRCRGVGVGGSPGCTAALFGGATAAVTRQYP